jgi:hypothetical protein
MMATEQHRHDGRGNHRGNRIVLARPRRPHIRAGGSRPSALHPVTPHRARSDSVERMTAGNQSQTVTRRYARGPPLVVCHHASRRRRRHSQPVRRLAGHTRARARWDSQFPNRAHVIGGSLSMESARPRRRGRRAVAGQGSKSCRNEGWRTLARKSRECTTQESRRTADQEAAATVAQALGRCHQILSTPTRARERRCPFTGRPGPLRRRLRCRSPLQGFVV